jgi:phage repressor protein C with HTH and peptisase S24 domain
MPKTLSVNSDNELYKSWEIKPNEASELHVHGRVLWGWLGKEL